MPTRLNSSENPDPAIAADFLEEEHPTSSGHEEHQTSYGHEEHHDRKRRDVQSDPTTEVKKITR
jgi:hypothetical protein